MNMIRLLAALVIIYVLYRIARRFFRASPEPSEPIPNRQAPAITEDLVEDPFCHSYLPLSQAYRASIDGRTEYFCSEKCYRAFVEEKGQR
jgi:YHS domain-containing protein